MVGLVCVLSYRAYTSAIEHRSSFGSEHAHLNCRNKNRRDAALLTISETCAFHLRLLDIVKPKSFAVGITSKFLLLTAIGSKLSREFLAKLIRSSLHLASFSLKRSCWDCHGREIINDSLIAHYL